MFKGRISRLAIGVGILSITIGSVALIVFFVLRFTAVGVEQPLLRLIVDTDAGIDDAVALFFALTEKSVKVEAITCVKGNTNVSNVVVNVLKILRISNQAHIPVYAGNNYGLLNNLEDDNYFGKDGLGDVDNFPNTPSVDEKQKENAAVQLVKMVVDNPGRFTLLFLGPLTNLALAMSICPEFLNLTKKVIIMGGSIRGLGNEPSGAEFNFHCDPDATFLVLERASLFSEVVTILPLEPVIDAQISQSWRWEELAIIKTKIVTFLNEIETAQGKKHPQKFYKPYDSAAVAVALIPNYVVEYQQVHAKVDSFGPAAQGLLYIDNLNTTFGKPNVDLVLKIDATLLQQHIYKNFVNYF